MDIPTELLVSVLGPGVTSCLPSHGQDVTSLSPPTTRVCVMGGRKLKKPSPVVIEQYALLELLKWAEQETGVHRDQLWDELCSFWGLRNDSGLSLSLDHTLYTHEDSIELVKFLAKAFDKDHLNCWVSW